MEVEKPDQPPAFDVEVSAQPIEAAILPALDVTYLECQNASLGKSCAVQDMRCAKLTEFIFQHNFAVGGSSFPFHDSRILSTVVQRR